MIAKNLMRYLPIRLLSATMALPTSVVARAEHWVQIKHKEMRRCENTTAEFIA